MPTDETRPPQLPFLALALSGGGSRAIAFHLGCLRALHDRQLLQRVRVISAVSGGSVIAACYAYWDVDFAEFDRRLVALLRRGLQRSIFSSALFSADVFRIPATIIVNGLLTLLIGILRYLLRLFRHGTGVSTVALQARLAKIAAGVPFWGSLTTAFERALERTLFGKATVDAVRRPNLEVVINSCDLRTGTAFRFGSQVSGGWRYGRIVGPPVTVAKAVAASAAYPLLLPPLIENFEFERQGQQMRSTVVLTDGGVFENLGVNVFEPRRDPRVSVNTYRPTHIICLNAGAGQPDGGAWPVWWSSRMKQSFVTVHRKVQENTYARLHKYVETGELDGFVMVYLGQDDDRLPAQPPNLIPRNAVRNYPTDFARMARADIARLAARGEQLTQILLDRYLQILA